MNRSDFIPIDKMRGFKCPVCGHAGWCMVTDDRTAVICNRVPSTRPLKNGGYLHKIGSALDGPIQFAPPRPPRPPREVLWDDLVAAFCGAVVYERLAAFAASLALSVASLDRLEIGAHADGWTFPMRDGGRIVGVRTRDADGNKRAIRGSRNGLFVPRNLSGHGPLLIAEGPTDTAALLDLGFDAIGRADCSSGAANLFELCRRREVVIMTDHDQVKDDGQVPGFQGATTLAKQLNGVARSVKIVFPSYYKDVREWLRNGATRSEVETSIKAAART